MPVSPLDYRYGRDPIKLVWSQQGRHERQLDVERALVWAHNQLGRVSDEDYAVVASISNSESVTVERVDQIESETKHDIMALTKAMAEAAGEPTLIPHEVAIKTRGFIANDVALWASFQPLFDMIVSKEPDLLD